MKTLFTILLAILICGCSDSTGNLNSNSEEAIYRASDFGDKWPFTTDEVEVFCDGYNGIYIKSEGEVYALNGRARGNLTKGSSLVDARDYEEIWRDNPAIEGTKVPVPSEIIEQGLSMCDSN